MADVIEEQKQQEVAPAAPIEKKSRNGAWFGLVIVLIVFSLFFSKGKEKA